MVFIALVIDILKIDLFFRIITHLKALLIFLKSFYEVCGIGDINLPKAITSKMLIMYFYY